MFQTLRPKPETPQAERKNPRPAVLGPKSQALNLKALNLNHAPSPIAFQGSRRCIQAQHPAALVGDFPQAFELICSESSRRSRSSSSISWSASGCCGCSRYLCSRLRAVGILFEVPRPGLFCELCMMRILKNNVATANHQTQVTGKILIVNLRIHKSNANPRTSNSRLAQYLMLAPASCILPIQIILRSCFAALCGFQIFFQPLIHPRLTTCPR